MHSASALSFDEVYDRHYRFVWRVLRAFGVTPAQVDDAAQDVFIVVHRRLHEFEGRSDVRTWLFRIARWVASSERRRERAHPPHEPIDEQLRDPSGDPFDRAARTEAVRTLERVLGEMDAEKRLVFLLMDVEEMKAAEVAVLLEINVNTVYSRLRLARDQFKKRLAAAETEASP